MQPTNTPPETPNPETPATTPDQPQSTPSQGSTRIIQPSDEAAVKQYLIDNEPVKPAQEETQQQGTPSEFSVDSEAKGPVVPTVATEGMTSQVQPADAATPQPDATPLEAPLFGTISALPKDVSKIEVPIKWGWVIGIGVGIPLLISIFKLLITNLLLATVLGPLFIIMLAFGPFGLILLSAIWVIPAVIAYSIAVRIIRRRLFLEYPRLIVLGTFAFILVVQPILTILSNFFLRAGPGAYLFSTVVTWIVPIIASVLGIYVSTLITNVYFNDQPKTKLKVMWAIILLPVVLTIILTVGSYVAFYSGFS